MRTACSHTAHGERWRCRADGRPPPPPPQILQEWGVPTLGEFPHSPPAPHGWPRAPPRRSPARHSLPTKPAPARPSDAAAAAAADRRLRGGGRVSPNPHFLPWGAAPPAHEGRRARRQSPVDPAYTHPWAARPRASPAARAPPPRTAPLNIYRQRALPRPRVPLSLTHSPLFPSTYPRRLPQPPARAQRHRPPAFRVAPLVRGTAGAWHAHAAWTGGSSSASAILGGSTWGAFTSKLVHLTSPELEFASLLAY